MAPLYALDTNVYIRALRDGRALLELERFLLRVGPRARLHAVVAMELRAGARTPPRAAALADLVDAYAARDRLIVPSFDAWMQAGRVLADLAVRERFDAAAARPSFVNDVVIAASCREAGVTLVTESHADFARIRRRLRGFTVTAPWPGRAARG
ncbi:MAG TPA: PIN domain-containing protein [Gemmatimonadaceae bacterium]